VIRLVMENRLSIPLRQLFGFAFDLIAVEDGLSKTDTTDALMDFLADRLKVHLREQGTRHDLIAAVFALGDEDDLNRLIARVEALSGFLASENGTNLLIAYRRAANIVRIEEKKDGASHAGASDPTLFQQDEEAAVRAALDPLTEALEAKIAAEDFTGAMDALAGLRGPVDAYFDKVTVNVEDAALRDNRLKTLSGIVTTMDQVADFSKVEG
jgi:glycyl-tRNA synthetase beta chain